MEIIKKKLKSKNNWLITGVAGFIGSNLAKVLLECNQRVIGIDNLVTGKKNNLQSFINKKNFIFLKKNILNLRHEHISEYDIDYVVHLAALSSVQQSFKKKNFFYKNNIEGFRNIKKLSLDINVKKFIYASSSSVYGNSELTNSESQKLKPLSPYAFTKLINEKDSLKKNKISQTVFVGLRLFNIFGKNQNFNSPYSAVLIKWINLLKRGKKIQIYGNGKNLRDFCHVNNVIYAIVLVINKKFKNNKIYNVASGKSISLNSLSKILIKYFGQKNKISNSIAYTNAKEGDIIYSKANLNKIKKEIKFSPIFKLENEIKKL
jgi:UDP-N-acetylglucosamine 4-epimerase